MGHFLAQSISSVLAQTYPNIEVIVIDDGSTDNTRDVVRPFLSDTRVRYQRQENGGQRAAKNAGICAAQGDCIAFNDADDFWYPQKLERQVPLFRGENVGVVYSERDLVDEHGNPTSAQPTKRFRGKHLTGQMLVNNFIPFSTCVIARRCIEQHGMFDEQMEGSIDYDLWLRYSLHYAFDYVPEPLAAHRRWSGQMSQNKKRRFEAAIFIQERFLQQHSQSVSSRQIALARAVKFHGRGTWRLRAGQKREAIRDFARAIAVCPTYLMPYKSMIRWALLRG